MHAGAEDDDDDGEREGRREQRRRQINVNWMEWMARASRAWNCWEGGREGGRRRRKMENGRLAEDGLLPCSLTHDE